jgi:hypothetical protein
VAEEAFRPSMVLGVACKNHPVEFSDQLQRVQVDSRRSIVVYQTDRFSGNTNLASYMVCFAFSSFLVPDGGIIAEELLMVRSNK